MKALTIRNIPDDLYQLLIRISQRDHRSLQQQALRLLEKARILDGQSPMERAFNIRKRLEGRHLGNTVKEIRKERKR